MQGVLEGREAFRYGEPVEVGVRQAARLFSVGAGVGVCLGLTRCVFLGDVRCACMHACSRRGTLVMRANCLISLPRGLSIGRCVSSDGKKICNMRAVAGSRAHSPDKTASRAEFDTKSSKEEERVNNSRLQKQNQEFSMIDRLLHTSIPHSSSRPPWP